MIVIGSAEGEETVQGSVGFGVGQLGSQYKIEEGLQVLRTVVFAESGQLFGLLESLLEGGEQFWGDFAEEDQAGSGQSDHANYN